MAKKKTAPVASIKHKDKRPNIPTRELRGFVEEAENKPMISTFAGLLYARDPSLDPQLVWKGKDELDRSELTVPCVPIYIQEKIHPHAIIDDIANRAAKKETPAVVQAELFFADFNGLDDFSKKVDFYHWGVHWSNRMILGDSLFVMTSLAEKEGLKGQVQMIYMDPPYGIKFPSNWQVSTRKRDVKDAKAEDCTRQPEQIKAFRDTWQYGINSYLPTLRDRFVVARELLTDSGSIFVQIGNENVHLVRCVLDEVFGADNYRAQITIKKTSGLSKGFLPTTLDFLLWYSKTERFKYRQLYLDKLDAAETDSHYSKDEFGRLVRLSDLSGQFNNVASCLYDFPIANKTYKVSKGRQWKTTNAGMNKLLLANRVVESGNMIYYRRYADDFPVSMVDDTWHDISGSIQSRSDPKIYVVQTSTAAIQRCMLMTTDPGDLVLDPTCGSGTTAYVAEQWGRRWITMDTSRVALALARTRLMAARYLYYLLTDSPDGIAKEAELTGQATPERPTENDIKKGFVYRRVPHVMLQAIANNEEIDTIHAKWQEKLEPLREGLNKAIKRKWEEWEIPREAEDSWDDASQELFME